MGMHKRLNIISTVTNAAVEDHGTSKTQGLHTSEMQGGISTSQEFQSLNEKVLVANKNKTDQYLGEEVNAYEKIRQLRVQENKKRLEEMRLKNLANSLTSLTECHKMKKKAMKQKTHAGDDTVTKNHATYISPMSTDRIANLHRLRRVMTSNPSENVSLTFNATDHNLTKGNKGGEKRKRTMVLVDEDDNNIEETFDGFELEEGNRVDIEADGVDMEADGVNQCDIEMVDRDNAQEQLQVPGIDKTTEGTNKKLRGPTRKPEIWKMNSTDRILVTFDKFGKPVGDEGKELVQYLGTLVRMSEHVSIEYDDWRRVPMHQKENMYTLVMSKFSIQPNETNEIKKWILHNMGKKWRTWKGALKSRGYDPSLTIDEIVTQQANQDDRVYKTQFKQLVTRWFTPEYQMTCAKKRSSRAMMKEPHVTGTKSFARLAHEVAMKNDGVYPTRGELYIATRTRKDGTIVDDKAAAVVASLKAIPSDPTSTPRDLVDLTHDDYSKVKGPEKSRYIRMVGRMPATKNNGDSPSNSQLTEKFNQLQNAFGLMMNLIQEHIPNANVATLLNNMNIEIPRIGTTSNKSLSSNELSSPRSHRDEDRVENM